LDSASKIYNTTIDGVVGYMKGGQEGFNYLVLRDITGVQVALHLTDGVIQDLLARFKAGPHPYDVISDPMRT
jgi:hypothetical protein